MSNIDAGDVFFGAVLLVLLAAIFNAFRLMGRADPKKPEDSKYVAPMITGAGRGVNPAVGMLKIGSRPTWREPEVSDARVIREPTPDQPWQPGQEILRDDDPTHDGQA